MSPSMSPPCRPRHYHPRRLCHIHLHRRRLGRLHRPPLRHLPASPPASSASPHLTRMASTVRGLPPLHPPLPPSPARLTQPFAHVLHPHGHVLRPNRHVHPARQCIRTHVSRQAPSRALPASPARSATRPASPVTYPAPT